MQESVNSKANDLNAIFLITIIARNDRSLYYYINENKEKRAKKIKDMYLYLIELFIKQKYSDYEIKDLSKKAYDLLWTFKSFMVDFENKEINELKFNLEKERKEVKKNYLKDSTEIDIRKLHATLSKESKKDFSTCTAYERFWKKS